MDSMIQNVVSMMETQSVSLSDFQNKLHQAILTSAREKWVQSTTNLAEKRAEYDQQADIRSDFPAIVLVGAGPDGVKTFVLEWRTIESRAQGSVFHLQMKGGGPHVFHFPERSAELFAHIVDLLKGKDILDIHVQVGASGAKFAEELQFYGLSKYLAPVTITKPIELNRFCKKTWASAKHFEPFAQETVVVSGASYYSAGLEFMRSVVAPTDISIECAASTGNFNLFEALFMIPTDQARKFDPDIPTAAESHPAIKESKFSDAKEWAVLGNASSKSVNKYDFMLQFSLKQIAFGFTRCAFIFLPVETNKHFGLYFKKLVITGLASLQW